MDGIEKRWTLGEIAAQLGGELYGPAGQAVSRPAPADSADPSGICFAGNRKFLDRAEASAVGAVILSPDLLPCRKPHIVVADPRKAFGRLLELWCRPLPIAPGIHSLAVVDPGAEVDETAMIGPYAIVERGARIGPRVRIYPFAYIGENCSIAEDGAVYPHAVLYQDVSLGPRTIVHAGAVLGADGFGFEWDGERQVKVPQVGAVQIGPDVEIGSNTCVDRAMSGSTVLSAGVKLDNLVQIGHNVEVGEHTVIAAQTGVSGSTHIGKRVTMGGSCATSDHVRIGDDIQLGGRTGVVADIDDPGAYWGTPARPLNEALRASLMVYQLPEILKRLRELEKRLGGAPPEDASAL